MTSIVTGARIVAAGLRGGYPQAVIKTVDEPVSNTTLQNDDELLLGVAASSSYLFACYLNYEAGFSAGQGFLQYEWTVPAAATLRFSAIGVTALSLIQSAVTQKEATSYTLNGSGAGVLLAATMAGTLVTAAAGGVLRLQWAQSSSSGTPTIVHAGSYLALWKIS